ncbi:MAG: hypothetical protein WBG49_15185 [Thermoanaerobaculia bacterium]
MRILALAMVAVAWSCAGSPGTGLGDEGQDSRDNTSLVVAEDGSAIITGAVLENDRGCVRDLQCFLRLKVEAEEAWVIYNEGEGPPCFNTTVAKLAFDIEVGQTVEARGSYRRDGKRHVLSTCPSTDYSLRVIDSASSDP